MCRFGTARGGLALVLTSVPLVPVMCGVVAPRCDADDAACERPADEVDEDVALLARRGQLSGAGGAGARNHRERSPSGEELRQMNYKGQQGQWCLGINAVGFDLAAGAGRGTPDSGMYTVPNTTALKYFADQGSNCFRVPMTIERMYQLGDQHLDLVPGIADTVYYITKNLSSYAIIDPHNNDQGLRYNGEDISFDDFVNLWKGAADKWGGDPMIIFALYNEPRYGLGPNGEKGYFDPDTFDRDGAQITEWTRWMQGAIDAIRAKGKDNLILVPGLHWTSTPAWSGDGWWGETLEGQSNMGNTRLASLKDPHSRIAYDVHSYMDPKFSGESEGCEGHEQSFWGGTGADAGLEGAIQWAQKYNKKFMMTEIGSWPKEGTETECQSKMVKFIKRMDESGVFIGRQVWQMGCPMCLADQWTLRPLNFAWYQIKRCANDTEDCGETACCYNPNKKCYKKDDYWASCLDSCVAGEPSPKDSAESTAAWNCTQLADLCTEDNVNCQQTKCCKNPKSQCYAKNDSWAACMPSCNTGEWSCEKLTRTSRIE